jgi:hypothetical protein
MEAHTTACVTCGQHICVGGRNTVCHCLQAVSTAEESRLGERRALEECEMLRRALDQAMAQVCARSLLGTACPGSS